MPKVSVVVPVYKVEKYIRQCLDSLVNQTLRDIEIIVVDDGSPDACPAISDEYATKDDRVKVIHKQNGGVSAARNDGLKIATGEYLIFCDSDDWVEPDAYRLLYEKAVETRADIVYSDIIRHGGKNDGHVCVFSRPFSIDDPKFIDELVKTVLYYYYCPLPPIHGPKMGYGSPCNKLVRCELVVQNGITFDTTVNGVFDDLLYVAHCLAHAKKVANLNIPTYNYRMVDTSITKSFKSNMLETNAAIFAAWRKFIAIYGKNGRYDEAYYADIIWFIDLTWRDFYMSPKYQGGFRDRVREFNKLMKTEPYKTALRKADYKALSKRHLALTIFIRIRLALVMFAIRYVWVMINKKEE